MSNFTELDDLVRETTKEKISIAEVEAVLQGGGFATLGVVICIPFIQPIPLPGLSVIFGLAILAIGLRIAVGSAGGLPAFAKRRELTTETMRSVVKVVRKLLGYVEKLFKPRLEFMVTPPALNLIGVSIALSGLALCLPLPPVILFSNSLPAWATILLCLGYLERDGLAVILGHVVGIATWVYFAFWWEAIKLGIESVLRSFGYASG